jgi:hypothetical protein
MRVIPRAYQPVIAPWHVSAETCSMRLSRLRQQMLVAIGVPACWTQQATHREPAPPHEQIVVSRHVVEPAIAVFDPASCGEDTLAETVCGVGDSDACGLDGSSIRLTSSDNKLHVTSWTEADKSGRSFLPDDKATDDYRARLGNDKQLAFKCCFSRCTPLVVGHASPQTVTSSHQVLGLECIPAPKSTSMPDVANPACAVGVKLNGELRPYSSGTSARCCYQVVQTRYNPGGRPARVDGQPELADIDANPTWSAPGVRAQLADVGASPAHEITELDPRVRGLESTRLDLAIAPGVRARLAEAWLESARLEHASIAAFANLALRLLAHGAPPDLIARTHAAALDEVVHARLTFGLASAYAGQPLGPARFAGAARMTATGDLAELALETFVDGCIGETVAALEASRAAELARDPVVAAILRRIAADETRHAELAWAIVAWCVRAEPALLGELDAALAEVRRQPRATADHDLGVHGVLGTAPRHDAVHDVAREVVVPCIAALTSQIQIV